LTDTSPIYFLAIAAPTISATILTIAWDGWGSMKSLYARLVSQRYQRLRKQLPELPGRYADTSNLAPLLQGILKPGNPAVAAIQGNQLVGFLTAWQMPDFRGKRSIYSPEWANAAVLDDSACIMKRCTAPSPAIGWQGNTLPTT
jgi:hypothetical protein